ncbi:bestrophin family ion channel [Runella sp. MFBS21]|uniref:bestrophin family protein n=1 Tax=Runella sp. MFBS21 TaxID=3034018 RepID=UPI0023F88A55|nr:bestrophin family ion channel [Runella sp. MFBS21]MDF7822218.1 bestrophin family ion channel [Runella sp. MFBS21]
MIVRKTLSLKSIYEFTGHHLTWLTGWMLLVTSIYYFTDWKFITLPWLPLSLIGTAVAFYVGFKNNQAYDRIWEARKIWGAMTNNSRKLATLIKHFRSEDSTPDFRAELRKQIVYRHIAYLYQLREQLLKPTHWEHVSLSWVFGSFNQIRRDKFFHQFKEELDEIACNNYLSKEEKNSLEGFNNKATQLLDKQTQQVQLLYDRKAINMMQQTTLQEVLNSFYDEQGKAERIKNFPFPRKYATFSFVFVCIFVFLLPFGIVGEFRKLGDAYVWLSVPVGVIIGWIYVVMEMIGDYSENPFEGLHNDIPMLTICRTIEIDMLQMIGDPNIPKPIQPKNHVLL